MIIKKKKYSTKKQKKTIQLVLIFLSAMISTNRVFSQWNPFELHSLQEEVFIERPTFQKYKLHGIKIAHKYSNDLSFKCISQRVNFHIAHHINNNETQKKILKSSPNVSTIALRVNKEYDFTQWLLRQGYGRIEKSEFVSNAEQKRWEKAEKEAQKYKRGIWSHCEKEYRIEKQPTQWKRSFDKKAHSYYAPISTAKVRKVITGNVIEIENGIRIALLGLRVPSLKSENKAEQCFAQLSKKYLRSRIEGKTVFLKRESTNIDRNRNLLRHIYLPLFDKAQTEIHINKEVIQEGYAQSHWESERIDTSFKNKFETIQNHVYQNPKGAFLECLQLIFNQ